MPKAGITLLAILATGATVPAPACAATTRVALFEAFKLSDAPAVRVTKTISGSCWTGSLTIRRSDAWRCISGNDIFDPCFSSSDAPGVVVCPNIDPVSGIEIRLAKELPYAHGYHSGPSLRDQPWDIQTTTGRFYAAASGATNVVDKQPLLYFPGSGGKVGLWGYPDRQTEPWTIYWAPYSATSLSIKVKIARAWM